MGTRFWGPVALVGLLLTSFAGPAAARPTFKPRIRAAMGLEPPAGSPDIAIGEQIPVVYHGGTVMSGVTVHTVFWAPPGYKFDGSPRPGVPGYEALIQQFFTDAAHDSGNGGNLFSLLDQYGSSAGQGRSSISYSATADTVNDSDPFPAQADQCASPSGAATCVTDAELSHELDRVIAAHDPAGYGLHDLWEVFLPPGVDECITGTSCGTNSFAGYHALDDEGHGEFIYAVMIDPLLEAPPVEGDDPQGNPEAETTIDTAVHETIESVTDPEGDGWMDPNGFEVGDKCENGPQQGTPLGYAADGAPYNQVLGGHQYDVQTLWSNPAHGCVPSSTVTTSPLPLASVSLRQFSSRLTGSIGQAKGGVGVEVGLLRGGDVVATAAASTRSDGSWGPVTLLASGRDPAPHAVGDDRDAIVIDYAPGGPAPDLIGTGSGGNPFTETGWTGWFDLDNGFAVSPHAVTIGPCGQTGFLAVTVNGQPTEPPIRHCSTEADQATVPTPPLSAASAMTMSSDDNRAVSPLNPNGALVELTVPLGEPGSVGALANPNVFFAPGGEPACTADLRLGIATCSGLVPGARYTLTRARGRAARDAWADENGTIRVARLPGRHPLTGGDRLTLTNSARRTLTELHVAHLRVDLKGDETVIASGTCQPGDYFGPALRSLPASASIGEGGATGLGRVCPSSGRAAGLPDATIAQIDDLSGGQTRTTVPLLLGTAPSADAIVSGAFTALAQTGVATAVGGTAATGAAVELTIYRSSPRYPAFHAANVSRGVPVPALPAGVYDARWVVRDGNGDTRTVMTKFVVQ